MKKIIISACLLLGSISASAPISSGEPSAHFFELPDANKIIVNLNDTIEGSARKICSSTKGSAQTCDVYSSIDNQVLISIKEGIGLKVWVSQRK